MSENREESTMGVTGGAKAAMEFSPGGGWRDPRSKAIRGWMRAGRSCYKRVMRMHWLVVVAALTGCAGKLEEVVREQAAKDLRCPAAEVEVFDQRSDNYVRDYSVSGCGQTAHYQAACSMVESCVAYRPDKLGKDAAGSEALTAGIDAVPGGESVEEVAVAEDGTVTVTQTGPPAPAPETKTPLAVAEAAEVTTAASRW
jgi:hypothetical protein